MLRLDVFYIFSTDSNWALLNIPKAGNQLGDGTFSAAGRANQCGDTPRRDFQRDILDNIFLSIRKGNIL